MKLFFKKKLTVENWNKLILFYVFLKSINYYLFRVFPIKNNKVVVSNFNGQGFGDNGKYIVLELLKREEELDIVWLCKKGKGNNIPNGIRIVQFGTLKSIFELTTSKIWIDNVRKLPEVRKRKKQFYINTGHGGIPLKKVEKDAEENLSFYYILQAKNDSNMLDIMTSDSKFRTNILKRSYWYDGKVIECGSPKIELLLKKDSNTVFKVKEYFKLGEKTKILLYAPTFRSENSFEHYNIDFKKLKKNIEKKFGGQWEILLRLHPNLADINTEKRKKITKFTIDATSYPDMQEILIASDILITDYSGTMFEYLHTDKPVFLYANDIEKYDRGFYFKFNKLPFLLANNNGELEKKIDEFNYQVFKEKSTIFKQDVGLINKFGASKTIADLIINTINY